MVEPDGHVAVIAQAAPGGRELRGPLLGTGQRRLVDHPLVALGDAGDFVLFAITSVIVSLAVVPVAMTRSAQPAPITLVRLRPRHLYNTSPAAFISRRRDRVIGRRAGA